MEIHEYLIGMVIFIAVITGGVLILKDMNSNYEDIGTNISTNEYSKIEEQTDGLYNISQDFKDTVLGSDIAEADAISMATKSAFSGIRFINKSFALIGAIIESLATQIGIPAIFITLMLIVFVISVAFTIIYLVFGLSQR